MLCAGLFASIVMSNHDLSGLSTRWLGKAWEHATAAERAVLTQMHRREHIARPPSSAGDDDRTFGERVADGVARLGGSWTFIGMFMVFLGIWVTTNVCLLLSMLAALQAPVIMMSQNRHAERDREAAEHDYQVNLKAELEIMALHDKLDQLRVEQLEKILEAQSRQIALLQQLIETR
jgi:uncharacterized membrane protein